MNLQELETYVGNRRTLVFTLPSTAVVSPTDKSVLGRGAAPPAFLAAKVLGCPVSFLQRSIPLQI